MVFESADEPFAVTLLSLVADILLPNRRSNTIYVLILNTWRKTKERRLNTGPTARAHSAICSDISPPGKSPITSLVNFYLKSERGFLKNVSLNPGKSPGDIPRSFPGVFFS